MKGILYGVGVGPGDPELLTAKAIRLLRECDAVAAPKSADGRQTALDIASPYIGQDKSILLFDMPMTHDRQARNASHDAAADALCALLDEGKTVVFLTLGDPTVYSTYWYVHKRVTARGYAAELVPGVPSFCAAAAAMGRALCEDGDEAGRSADTFTFSYEDDLSIAEKIEAIAKKIYHADGVNFTANAEKQIKTLTELGYDHMPICMAKTQYSFTDDQTKLGAPRDFTITVRNVKVSAGAGFLVALTGEIMTMPGLPKVPAAERIDVDETGKISGLF